MTGWTEGIGGLPVERLAMACPVPAPPPHRAWRPGLLTDGEIAAELADPATSPDRREALADEQAARKHSRAEATRMAREAAQRAAGRVTGRQATGGWP